ncbi:MAG: histone deacetylase [Gemmatimonadota bacterium]|nr:histone deacetylase [Gemmatimonadota bacterium]
MTTRREFVATSSAGLAGLGLAPLMSRSPGALLSTARATGTGFVFEERSLAHVLPPRRGEPHPERPLRLRRIHEELTARGLIDDMTRLAPRDDVMTYIRGHHTATHVDAIEQIEITGPIAELAVGGALTAVDAVANGDVANAFCAIRPPGHHANNTGAEEGFCFYSNAAIAAKYAQSVHGLEKVLIIDWDYHHGNGTQNAFYDDPSVLFFSAHDWEAYPQTGDPSLVGEGDGRGLNINVHLECGSKNADMLSYWDGKLDTAVSSFRPDLVLISAGFDSRQDDLLGCFDLTDEAFRVMTRRTMDYAESCCDGKVVSLLEGGYNVDGLALATAAHVETLLGN